MPIETDTMREQGFRSSLFGFDKNDVLAYMDTLANANRQQELEYREQLSAMQDELEHLNEELQMAQRRALEAEQRAQQAEEKCAHIEGQARQIDERYKVARKTITELRFKCRELEAGLAERKQAPEPERPAPAPEPPAPAPQPEPKVVEPPAPAVKPVAEPKNLPELDVAERARVEARKILTDARLYAETAERQLKEQIEDQKSRMAEHARDLAASVWLLRDRLARVDEKINAATVEMENSTAAIYRALDEVGGDLNALGARLRDYDPEDPVPSGPPSVAVPPETVFEAVPQRQRATARPVRHAVHSTGRLRSVRSARVTSKDLAEAAEYFGE